jgi:hypothetical protein
MELCVRIHSNLLNQRSQKIDVVAKPVLQRDYILEAHPVVLDMLSMNHQKNEP